MIDMQISVIIPTHNRPDKLANTLAGLQRQTLSPGDYEIIVVDDGSTPPVALKADAEGPCCILVRLEGLERSAARNAGANRARGELLVFMDDDISVQPDFLEAHRQAEREWPNALVVGAIHLPGETRATSFGRFRHDLEQSGVPLQRGLVAARNFCAAGNMSIPRASFLALGGFDLGIASSEDQDLALRHTASGGQIVYLPEAAVLHCDNALDIRSYCRRNEWGSEQMIPFCRRYRNCADNIERERVNGPVLWGREPFKRSLLKVLKAVSGVRPVITILFGIVSLLENVMPRSRILDKFYRLLLGIHIQRGYRRGLMRYGALSEETGSSESAGTKAVDSLNESTH